MNKTLSAILTVIAVIALAAVIFLVGSMYARTNAFGPSMMNGYGITMPMAMVTTTPT